jgi:hypothetical protein
MSDEAKTINPISRQEPRWQLAAIPLVAGAHTLLGAMGGVAIGLLYFIPVVSLIVSYWLGVDVPTLVLCAAFFSLVLVAVGLKSWRRARISPIDAILFTGLAAAAIVSLLLQVGVL